MSSPTNPTGAAHLQKSSYRMTNLYIHTLGRSTIANTLKDRILASHSDYPELRLTNPILRLLKKDNDIAFLQPEPGDSLSDRLRNASDPPDQPQQ